MLSISGMSVYIGQSGLLMACLSFLLILSSIRYERTFGFTFAFTSLKKINCTPRDWFFWIMVQSTVKISLPRRREHRSSLFPGFRSWMRCGSFGLKRSPSAEISTTVPLIFNRVSGVFSVVREFEVTADDFLKPVDNTVIPYIIRNNPVYIEIDRFGCLFKGKILVADENEDTLFFRIFFPQDFE
jgi:hypothetical protein